MASPATSFLPNLNYEEDWDRVEEAHAVFLKLYNVTEEEVPLLLYQVADGEDKNKAAAPFSVVQRPVPVLREETDDADERRS